MQTERVAPSTFNQVTISARNILDGDPVAIARITYEIALQEFQRAGNLVKDQIISAKDYEQVRLRYETARTFYEGQAGNFTSNGVRVTAPISGYVTSRMVTEGEYVSVGHQGNKYKGGRLDTYPFLQK